jgi:hypothetical protein
MGKAMGESPVHTIQKPSSIIDTFYIVRQDYEEDGFIGTRFDSTRFTLPFFKNTGSDRSASLAISGEPHSTAIDTGVA